MTSRALWDRYRALLLDEPRLGFRLDLSRLVMPDDALASREAAMQAALDAMERLEAGAIANPDEQRMVGHYWLRDPERAPSPEIAALIRQTTTRITDFAAAVHAGRIRPAESDRFRHLLVVGIGGSALGPQFVADALGGTTDRLEPHFLDNTDPDGFDRVLGRLGEGLRDTLVVVISKSGGTPETRNGMLEVEAAFRAQNWKLGPHAVAITQEGSLLDRYATDHGFMDRFPMWDWVGGRTSETSAVGLLPAALQGIDIDALLAGAAEMDAITRRRETRRNPAALMALAWHIATEGRGARDLVILPYKDRLALLSRYLQQLIMESIGKERDLDGRVVHQGLAVYGNKGSTDQHAYVQQLRDGVPNFFATFVEVLRDRDGGSPDVEPGVTSGDFLHGFLLGTRRALFENGRSSLTITLADVSPRAIGQVIALYERTVGLYASLVHVNAYHQPGVEAGKKAAAGVLALQARVVTAVNGLGGRAATIEEIAAAAGAPEEVETVFHLLEHLAANPGRGIVRHPADSPFAARFSAGS